MGEYLDLPAQVSPSLREEKGHAGITLDNYQILPPSSNHIYRQGGDEQRIGIRAETQGVTWMPPGDNHTMYFVTRSEERDR